jgi:hypothetical protein
VRTANQPISARFELGDDQETLRHQFLSYTFWSCSPDPAHPAVLDRPDFVAAAPTLPGVPQVRLPPASPDRYDGQATKVSHLHPNQQRLVAHTVLINANNFHTIETSRIVDKDTVPFGQNRIIRSVPPHP